MNIRSLIWYSFPLVLVAGCVPDPGQTEHRYMRLELESMVPYIMQVGDQHNVSKQIIVLPISEGNTVQLKVLEEVEPGQDHFARCKHYYDKIQSENRELLKLQAKRMEIQKKAMALLKQKSEMRDKMAELQQKRMAWLKSLPNYDLRATTIRPARAPTRMEQAMKLLEAAKGKKK